MRNPHTPLALFAAAVAFLLPVAFSPSVQATFWTPAAAICLVVGAVGAPLVAALWMTSARRAAVAATAFVAVAFVSATISSNRTIGFLGLYYWGTGWLFIVALVGAWAVGRSLDGRGAALVERAILAAALLNAAIAVLEATVDLGPLRLGRYGDRTPGLLGNPIHLGAFAAAAIALAAPRVARSPFAWGIAVALLGAAVQTAGSRFGIIVAIAVIAWSFVAHGRRVGIAILVFAFAGAALGALASRADGGSQIASSRVAMAAANGVTPRVETWRAGAAAMSSRPLLGWGPGQFRTATSPRRNVELARAEGPDKLFVDAHNIVVEYGVTTGLLGLAAFGAWLVLAGRGASGALFVFAIADLANHLVEPQSVRTTPVAFLALGAAAAAEVAVLPRVHRAVMGALVAVAVAAGGWLLAGDFHLEQARLDFAAEHARLGAAMLPWPEAADARARVDLFEGRVTRSDARLAEGITWLRRAAERDPEDPTWWHRLGDQLLAAGRTDEADRAFARALERNPVSVRAMNGRAFAAIADHRNADAVSWLRRSLGVEPAQRDIRRTLARLTP